MLATQKNPWLRLVVQFVLTGILLQSAWADTTTDQYILGYATAILEQQFKIQAGSLQVKEGVITVMSKDLPATDRERVIKALQEIKGVVRVDVMNGQPTTMPPVNGGPTPERAAV